MVTKKDNDKKKLPIIKLLVGDFDLLFMSSIYAWVVVALFALAETLLLALSGNLLFCANGFYRAHSFCNNNLIVFVVIRLVIIFIECIFVRNWVDIALNKKQIIWKKIFIPEKRDLKVLGVFFGYVLTLLAAGLSFYLLYIRIPNPDWRIEVAYFTMVAWGFLLPIAALRLAGYLAAAAMGESLPKLSEMWHKTSGNFAKILGGTSLLILIILFIWIQVSRFIWQAGEIVSYLQVLTIEYIISFVKLTCLALVVNFCYIQYKLLFGSDDNE